MSHNTFGHLFRVTTWGESHGPCIGCVIDGCPPGIPIATEEIQKYLDRRRPGRSRYTSQRKEDDRVLLCSGVFNDTTTGTPISIIIQNTDTRSRDYDEVKDAFRPGHADITYFLKYGIRDHRGGGRSSARETAARVSAGAIARMVLGPEVVIRAAVEQIGDVAVKQEQWNWDEALVNDLFCPCQTTYRQWSHLLEQTRRRGSSVGAIIRAEINGVRPGLGAPLYGKLDADLAGALMGINAVKAVEVGEGFAAAVLRGEQNADQLFAGNPVPLFKSNHAGGILGGISTGQPITLRFAVKPTSSILVPQPSITVSGEPTQVVTRGRHDPCVGIRAVPVAEAMVACVLADHLLRHRAQISSRSGIGDKQIWTQ